MNYLKIKLRLFSLLTVLATSVFLTSCEQEDIISNITDVDQLEAITVTPEMQEKSGYFRPAKGFEEKTDAEKQAYLNQLTGEQSAALEENYRIADYLHSMDILERADAMLSNGELLSDVDLTTIVSTSQMQQLNQHQVSNIEARNCIFYPTNWCYYGCGWDRRVYVQYCGSRFIGYYYFCNINC